MSNKKITIVGEPQEDPDFLLVLDYLRHVEIERKPKLEWAQKQNINPVTMWRWTTAWTQSGLLPKCREVMGMELFEDVIVANRRAVRQWEKISEEWVRLALTATREDVRLNAIHTLYDKIVKPMQERQPDQGSSEREYIDMITLSADALDPLSVSRNLPKAAATDESQSDLHQDELDEDIEYSHPDLEPVPQHPEDELP